MNWGTLRQTIIETINGQVGTDRVNLAMVRAMRYWRTHPTVFNRSRIELETVAAQDAYADSAFTKEGGVAFTVLTAPAGSAIAIPDPIIEIRKLFEDDGTSYQRPIAKDSVYAIQEMRSSATVGEPIRWAFWDRQLVLWPVPDAVYDLKGFAIVDLGTPQALYAGSAWAIRMPDGTTTLPDGFTTAWLTDGFEVIMLTAMADLYQNTLQGQGGAEQAAACLAQAQARLATFAVEEGNADFPTHMHGAISGPPWDNW